MIVAEMTRFRAILRPHFENDPGSESLNEIEEMVIRTGFDYSHFICRKYSKDQPDGVA